MALHEIILNPKGNGGGANSGGLVGTWNASTNTPTLSNTDTGKLGVMYQVSTGGSVDFGAGSITFEAKDIVINNGSVWDRIDSTDAVLSVASKTGVVTLTADDMTDGTTNKVYTATEKTKLSGVETGATADQTDLEIETAYNNQVAIATQAEAEAGTLTSVKRFTPERIKQAIAALSGGLSYFTTTTATNGGHTASVLSPTNTDMSFNLSGGVTSGGFFSLNKPDGTSSGGAKRGDGAVDMQISRTSATQIASGIQSGMLGGRQNTCSADRSFSIGGDNNNIKQANGVGLAGWGTTGTTYGEVGMGSSPGYQGSLIVLSGSTSDATPKELAWGALTTDTFRVILSNNEAISGVVYVTANNITNGECAKFTREFLIRKGSTMASTTLVGSGTIGTDIKDTTLATADVTLSADTISGLLHVNVTGVASKTVRWTAFLVLSRQGIS